MTHRLAATLLVLLVPSLLPSAPAGAAEPSGAAPNLVLVSWDGAGDAWIDRLLDEGHLPNLARLAEKGARAAHLVGTTPSKTAPSHASIYTGCGPAVHGVSANAVPFDDDPANHTLLEARRGFSAEVLRAEPFFVTAAKADRRVAILSASHYVPHAALEERFGPLPAGSFVSFSPFEDELVESAVFGPDELGNDPRFEIPLGDDTLAAELVDDPEDPVEGFDTVVLHVDPPIRLKPLPLAKTPEAREAAWSSAVPVRSTGPDGAVRTSATFFRLFELSADGSRFALYRRRASAQVGKHTPEELALYENAAPGGHDQPLDVYGRGGLGIPLGAGGDGTVEARMVEIAAFDLDLRVAGTRAFWRGWRPDVLFHYTPLSDQFSHAWAGILDADLASHDPDLAAALWPHYVAVFREIDRWLGTIVDLAERSSAIVAVVSDHGMAGIDRDLHLVRLLADAGLLTLDAEGRIDLAGTRMVPTRASFGLRVNAEGWKGGIVPESERRATIRTAADALLAARDPETGQPIVDRVHFPHDEPDLVSGVSRFVDDLYFDPAPGIYPNGRPNPPEAVVTPSPSPWGAGVHGFSPELRSMHAIFYLAGPGVARGVETPAARQIDVAPTLARLAGLPAPADACGRVLFEALADSDE